MNSRRVRAVNIMLLGQLIALFLVFAPGLVMAQVPDGGLQTQPSSSHIVPCSGVEASDGMPACNMCQFVLMVKNIIDYAIYLAVILSSLMFAYAGFLFLTNNGDRNQVKNAISIFKKVVYGIIAVLAAWLLVDAIMTKLAGDSLGQKWNTITGCNLDSAQTGSSSNITHTALGNVDLSPYDNIPTEEYYASSTQELNNTINTPNSSLPGDVQLRRILETRLRDIPGCPNCAPSIDQVRTVGHIGYVKLTSSRGSNPFLINHFNLEYNVVIPKNGNTPRRVVYIDRCNNTWIRNPKSDNGTYTWEVTIDMSNSGYCL